MISLPRSCPARLRLRSLVAPLLVLLWVSASAPSCGEHTCTAIGCQEGLNITLDDSFQSPRTFTIELAEITATPKVVRFMTCTLSASGIGAPASQVLACTSTHDHSETGNSIVIRNYRPAKMIISVASENTVLAARTFEPKFSTREINGPGCGTCTNATVVMSIP